jgi:hypothetical protein
MQTQKTESLKTRKIRVIEWSEADRFEIHVKLSRGSSWNSNNERIRYVTLGINIFDSRYPRGLARVRPNRRDRSLDG